jgi:hypothetical protein
MWSYLTTRFFINPPPGYVENKVVLPKVLRLDEVALVTNGTAFVQALASVPGSGDASKTFLQSAAPTRLR